MKNFILSLIISVTTMGMMPIAYSSTFIGNGGNAGDVELQVTVSQITNTLNLISNLSDDQKDQLCQCEKILNQHKVCESLNNMTQRQSYYCADQIATKAKDILKIIQADSGIQYIWTSKAMEVSEKNGGREADAIANAKLKRIVLNREQFLKLKDYERVYLLTHELGHLIEFDKKYVSDDQPTGPFKQDDGGRQFLNSMAAAVTMKSLTSGQVSDYQKVLNTSKSYKENWLMISMGTEKEREDQSRLAIQKYSGWDLQYRRMFNQNWGVSIGGRIVMGEETFFNSSKAETEMKVINSQLNYRLFPFQNPLSVLGQSHIVFGLGIEAGQADYKIQDDYTNETDSANLLSPVLSTQYFLALSSGIWLNGGVTYTNHKYTFSQIGLNGYKSDPNQYYFNIGASYGF